MTYQDLTPAEIGMIHAAIDSAIANGCGDDDTISYYVEPIIVREVLSVEQSEDEDLVYSLAYDAFRAYHA